MAHIPQLRNNQYTALSGEEDNEENDTDSIGVDNDGEITGVRHDNKTTGVDNDNESTESGCTVVTDKVDELELIEEAMEEAERNIAEGNDLLARTETETEEARNENVIH